MTMADMSVDADDSIRSSDLERVVTRLRSLLARVASGEVTTLRPGSSSAYLGAWLPLKASHPGGESTCVRCSRNWCDRGGPQCSDDPPAKPVTGRRRQAPSRRALPATITATCTQAL